MKYIKLFEAFTNHNHKTSYSGIPKISERRSKGSVNWLNRDRNRIVNIAFIVLVT